MPLLLNLFLLRTSSPSCKSSPASGCSHQKTPSKEKERSLRVSVRFPPHQPPQDLLNLPLLGSLWPPLSAGSMAAVSWRRGNLPGKTLSGGYHPGRAGTCPMRSLQAFVATWRCSPCLSARGKPVGPAGAYRKVQGLWLSEAISTSGKTPSVVSRPSSPGSHSKRNAEPPHLVSFPLQFPVLLLRYRGTSRYPPLTEGGPAKERC